MYDLKFFKLQISSLFNIKINSNNFARSDILHFVSAINLFMPNFLSSFSLLENWYLEFHRKFNRLEFLEMVYHLITLFLDNSD